MAHTHRTQDIRCGGRGNTHRREPGECGSEVTGLRPGEHALVVADAGPERLVASAAILGAPGAFARSVASCAVGRLAPA